jgi:hypothetical protein
VRAKESRNLKKNLTCGLNQFKHFLILKLNLKMKGAEAGPKTELIILERKNPNYYQLVRKSLKAKILIW